MPIIRATKEQRNANLTTFLRTIYAGNEIHTSNKHFHRLDT